ncbi:MAG TPA: hypothetical protein VF322_10680 [Gammaproteobacteria bacterium]
MAGRRRGAAAEIVIARLDRQLRGGVEAPELWLCRDPQGEYLSKGL